MEKKILKRNRSLFFMFFLAMVLLLGRVAYIQLISHEELKSAAVSQYEVMIEGLDTRGRILDRNYMPLTGGTNQYYYFIKRENCDENLMASLKDIDGKEVGSEDSPYRVFRTEKFDEEENEKLKTEYGAYVFRSGTRYADDQIACHLIGYLNQDQKTGVSGLELLYQEELAAGGEKLSLWADAGGTLIEGQTPKVLDIENDSKFEGNSLVTTIDRRLQYVAESALETASKDGAIIVMDAESGEILTMASAPTFNPNNIESYLTSGGDCLINKATQGAYPPGSVFKIVTAAAALENGISPQKEFECEGHTTVGGVELNCEGAKDGGHGVVNMKQAMAVSCNCYFARLGEEIGVEKIIEQATKMGLGKKTMDDYPEESEGNIPEAADVSEADTSNVSIGQGTILVTPLQIAQMTAVIAGGGKYVSPTVVFEGDRTETVAISEKNAMLIEDMLAEVMLTGTGSSDWDCQVWGKTGTAETGRAEENSNCCWLTGYCKFDETKYVITVMIEDGKSAAADALPVFEDIVEYLNKTKA